MANYIKANNTTALNTSGSWTIAGVPTQADTVQWNSTVTGANTVALGGALNVKGVIITNPGGAVTIGTTAANFAIDLSGIDMSAATQDLTINSPTVVYLIDGSTQTWNVASGRTLTVSSTLNGSGALIKSNSGTLALTGGEKPNNISVTLSGGTTTLASIASGTPNQFGSSAISSVAIATGASLRIQGNTTYTTSNTFTGSGSGTILVRNTSSSGIVFNGTMSGFTGLLAFYADSGEGLTTAQKITLSSASQFAFSAFYFQNGAGQTTSTQTLSYTGNSVLTQTGSIVLAPNSGTFTAVYSNDSLNSSAATVSGPVQLQTATNATLQLAATNGALTFSNILSETSTGVLSVTKTGTNAATLSSANTFKGLVSVSAGTLNANSATALGATSSAAGISVSSGATLSLGGASNITYTAPRTLTLAGTGVGGTTGALVINNAVTNTFSGIALTAGTLVRASESGTLTAPVTTNNHNLTFTVAAGKTLTLPSTSVISASTSTVSYNTVSGDTGTAVVSAQNLYTNPTVIDRGAVRIGASSVGSPGSLTSGPLGRGQLTWNGGALDASTTATLGNNVVLGGDVSFGGTAALTLAGTVSLSASRTITTNGSGGALTLSGVVSGTGFGLTKAGTNTLILSGANTYTGATTLAAGIAQANVAQNGSTSGPFGTNGSIAFTGGTLQYSANNATDYSSRFLTGSNAQWRIDTNGRNVTFATFVPSPGTASLVKLGSGTLSLTGLVVGSGGTTVSAGTLSFTGANTLGSGSITVNGGTLQWGSSTTQDYSSQLVLQNGGSATLDVGANNVTFANAVGSSSSSTFTKAGSGTLTLQAANTWSGTTTISAGTLSLTSVASLGSGTYSGIVSIASGAVFSLSSSATQTLSGQITGLGSVAKSGTGNLALTSSTSNYVGGTTLTGSGVLTIGTNSALGTGTLTLDGASFDVVSSGIAITNTVAVANSNQVRFVGSGTLTLNGSFVIPSTKAVVLVDANVLTVGGATTGSGALEVWGPGKTVLTNTGNAHAGGTTLQSNAVLEFSSGTIPAGSLALTQGTLRWATGNTQDVSSQIASTGSVTFDTNGNDVTLASSFGSASSTVTKVGAGILTLSGSNSWTLGTTLTTGTIKVGNAAALGSGTLTFNGGTLDATAPGYTVANALNVDSGTITFAGTAALTLSANLRLGFLASSKTITTNGSGGALTLAGILSNATSATTKLIKAGTNALKLTGANTYSGGTDITSGTVQTGNVQALGTSGTVTLTTSGAALQTLNSVNGKLTVANLTNSAGGTIRIGG